MDYSTDKAIESSKEDVLGRKAFSQELGKAILEYKGTDSLVIGLFGEWGSGKTSVMNMALSTIIATSSYPNEPLIIKFAPWNYSDKEHLIQLFFSEMQIKVKNDKNKNFRKIVGKALKEYSVFFEVASFIPYVGFAVAPLLKASASIFGDMMSKSADLDKTKTKLSNALKKANRRIVVVIDDIDRLTNKQIQDVFQLVKQVGDLPNILYVLLMDRQVVINALSEIHNCNGAEYLEKIVQIPIEIPELDKSKIGEIFYSKLCSVLKEFSRDSSIDELKLAFIANGCIYPYLNTLRDVNRVINVFRFRIRLFLQEISIEDLVGIIALEVFNPDLYKWIANNKMLLCEPELEVDGNLLNDSELFMEYFKNVFSQFETDASISCKSVSVLFPKFGHYMGYNIASNHTKSNVNVRSLADKKSFDIFFGFNRDVHKIDSFLIHQFIYNSGENELADFILETYQNGDVRYLIKEFYSFIDGIPYNRIVLCCTAFISVAGRFTEENLNPISSNSAIADAERLISSLINLLDTCDERFEVLYSNMKKCDVYTFRILAKIIIGVLTSSTINLSEFQQNALKDIYSTKARRYFWLLDFSMLQYYIDILLYWNTIDSDYVKIFILRKLLVPNINQLKLLCMLVTNDNKMKYYFLRYEDSSVFFTDFEAYRLIDKFDINDLDDYSYEEQLKIAALSIGYRNRKIYDLDNTILMVPRKNAINQLDMWKAQIDFYNSQRKGR